MTQSTPSERKFLPYAKQSISEADIRSVVEVLQSDFLTTGPMVDAFETAFCEAVGAKHAIAVSNGTAALHLAMMDLGIGPGDWVIVPPTTFLATANAVRYMGGDVLFCDVDPTSGLMTPESLLSALDEADRRGLSVKAFNPVHLRGDACDLRALANIAKERGLKMVEDCCHAIGTVITEDDGNTIRIGDASLGDFNTFSLHAVKTFTTGEGGIITTSSAEAASRLKWMRSHGVLRDSSAFKQNNLAFDGQGNPNPWYYEMQDIGFNYRLTDFQSALGISQLSRLSSFLDRREQLMQLYDERLKSFSNRIQPAPRNPKAQTALHLYAVNIDFKALGKSRAQLMRELAEHSVGTQVHYIPVNRQPYYETLYGKAQTSSADAYYEQTLSLPFYPDMEDSDVDHVISVLRKVLGE